MTNKKEKMSPVRKDYFLRLAFRIFSFLFCLALLCFRPEEFEILGGYAFFSRFSLLHLLWAVWVFDMVLQIIPIRNKLALGSQKLFATRFRPIRERMNYRALKEYIISTTKGAYKVFLIWTVLILSLGILYYHKVIDENVLFLITVFFYVCDLICVLIWCPFRLIMKNKCCTTCRIFNWDHLMMFSPLIFLKGFYPLSLVALSLVAFALWEFCVLFFPERFWERTNSALQCSECTDKLCTQYCQKLR